MADVLEQAARIGVRRRGLPRPTVQLVRDLAAEIESLRAQLAEAKEEGIWIRDKLGLLDDATFGDVCGKMHVMESNARGFTKYIEAYKCHDKQGEIARQSVRILKLEAQLAEAKAENERVRLKASVKEASLNAAREENAAKQKAIESMRSQFRTQLAAAKSKGRDEAEKEFCAAIHCMVEFPFACFSGDCPHSSFTYCAEAARDELLSTVKSRRAEAEGGESGD